MHEIEKIMADPELLENKKLPQIVGFIGDGRLRNGNDQFRQFLKGVSNDLLMKYAEECLDSPFTDSGLVLQDIVNEMGTRLGFQVTPGLYRGNKAAIGFDGIWQHEDSWNLIVEVKTTDAYRISLETIAVYRSKLAEGGEIVREKSSVLIVVGRIDTGELEAQIRGSKHAWDMRIISIDSLIRLLRIKESLSDLSTARQIAISLRPYEYTRVDKLIELLFLTVKDIEVEDSATEFEENDAATQPDTDDAGPGSPKKAPVNFHEPVLKKVSAKLGVSFIKQTKSAYASTTKLIGINISVSKTHPPYNSQFDARYWFAFHPHQEAFLEKFPEGYACYGCGNEDNVFALPLQFMKARKPDMWVSKKGDREYQHVVIYRKGDTFYFRTNVDGNEHYDDLEQYRVGS